MPTSTAPARPTDPSNPSDPTMHPDLRSWLPSAHAPGSDFPIQNLPLGIALDQESEAVFVVVACGDHVIDLDMLVHAGALGNDETIDIAHSALHMANTNLLMAEPAVWRELRRRVQGWLLDGPPGGQSSRRLREKAARPMASVQMVEPCVVDNYTDFYASIHHARTVGAMFRPDNPLLPNYKHVPIGYHGRASSVVASGTPITRPMGQTKPEGQDSPIFGACKRLDYELELGVVIGKENALGTRVPIDEVDDSIFGFVLVNDWSARDIQAWEYQPLGPFLSKNFATSISPWIVTRQAIEPYRVPGPARQGDDPQPLEYLRGQAPWGLDINLEVLLTSSAMRAQGVEPMRVCRGNFLEMYWTVAQLIAHHTSNGCPLLAGDLLASGTISGPAPDSRGCLLERTWQGNGPDGKPLPRVPLALPTGESRTFLEDGDEVIMRAWCERPGAPRIGFGECRGIIQPAV